MQSLEVQGLGVSGVSGAVEVSRLRVSGFGV